MSAPVIQLDWRPISPERNLLGESPFWHPEEQMLYWVDIPGRELLRCNVYMGTVEHWALPAEPGCIAPARAGGLVLALRDGIYRAREWGGALERIAPPPYDPGHTRFNDGRCDPQGRFWAGTLYEPRDQLLGELFCLDARTGAGAAGAQRRAGENLVANGLAWSPDGGTLYWAHTQAHRIDAWRFDAASGTLQQPRCFAQLPPKPEDFRADDLAGAARYGGRPDGAAVDAEGCYWSAQFEGGRLLRFAPTGALLAELPLPARCPTMPCFGGEDGRTLYVTTASRGRPAVEAGRWPDNGRVLAARVEVPGLPVGFFAEG